MMVTKKSLIVTGCAALVLAVAATQMHRQPDPKPPPAAKQNPLVTDVLKVFNDTCLECHGPKAVTEHKKAKFHYIDDLETLAKNPKYVIPGDPDKSLIYKQVVDDEMPPPDEGMTLTSAQRGHPQVDRRRRAFVAESRTPRPFMERLIAFIGRFHPLAAHTPIALLMAAAIAEILYLRHPAPASSAPRSSASSWGAGRDRHRVPRLGVGRVVRGQGQRGPRNPPLGRHHCRHHDHPPGHPWRVGRPPRSPRRTKMARHFRWIFRICVLAIAGLVGFTAHLGGILVWGSEIFNFPQY